MKTFICEICGDAYIGSEKPKNCPFCGAREVYIKSGSEANPIPNQKIEISEATQKNLKMTYDLEVRASAVYICMAGKAKNYEVKAMYKRLAKVELEHATIVTKLMNMSKPEVGTESCSDEDVENFKETVKLEENAVGLYQKFAQEATEKNIKLLFTALSQVESDHIELMKNYLVESL